VCAFTSVTSRNTSVSSTTLQFETERGRGGGHREVYVRRRHKCHNVLIWIRLQISESFYCIEPHSLPKQHGWVAPHLPPGQPRPTLNWLSPQSEFSLKSQETARHSLPNLKRYATLPNAQSHPKHARRDSLPHTPYSFYFKRQHRAARLLWRIACLVSRVQSSAFLIKGARSARFVFAPLLEG
jgi:hypothetical protein